MLQYYLIVFLLLLECSLQYNGCLDPVRSDGGECWCDISDYCDVSCCCDGQCSAGDLATFATCVEQYNLNTSCTCFSTGVMLRNNSFDSSRSYAVGNTSCFYQDTYEKLLQNRNYFIAPQCNASVRFLPKFYQYSKVGAAKRTRYLSGDVLQVVRINANSTDVLSFLHLPRTLSGMQGGECADNNAASFLFDEAWQCYRTINNIESACNQLAALSASTYYENLYIITDPSKMVWSQDSEAEPEVLIPTSISVAVEVNVSNTSYCAAIIAKPTYNDSTCTCVVTEVAYQVQMGTDGMIQSATVVLQFGTLASTLLEQRFSIQFVNSGIVGLTYTSEQSGAPGHVLGEPLRVLYNQSVYTNPEWLFASSDCLPSASSVCALRVLGSPSSSDCSICLNDPSACSQPVMFGRNYRSGCFFTVTADTFQQVCSTLQNRTGHLLSGLPEAVDANHNTLASYLPQFGVYRVGPTQDASNWQAMLVYSGTSPSNEDLRTSNYVCEAAVRSLTVQVSYVNTGSLASPQPAVVGIAYRLGAPERLVFNEFAYDAVLRVELSVAVVFVDMSLPPTQQLAYPTGRSSWEDFFYLFYVEQYKNVFLAGGARLLLPQVCLVVCFSLVAVFI